METEGKRENHSAQIVDVRVGMSSTGKSMVTFFWELEDGQRIRSYHVVRNPDGSSIDWSIDHLKGGFPAWDGTDENWFLDHADTVIGAHATLTVEHTTFNGQMRPTVKRFYISRTKAEPAAPIPTPLNVEIPQDADLTINGIWATYCRANPNLPKPELDAGWFRIIDRTLPNHGDLLALRREDWAKVYRAIIASTTVAV